MTIELTFLGPILGTAGVAAVGFLLKKVFVDRIDKLEKIQAESTKEIKHMLEELQKALNSIALTNANEHGEMRESIAEIRGEQRANDDGR